MTYLVPITRNAKYTIWKNKLHSQSPYQNLGLNKSLYSLTDELLKEIEDLQKDVYKIAPINEKLAVEENFNKKSCPSNTKISIPVIAKTGIM